jgi:hypothetical protein
MPPMNQAPPIDGRVAALERRLADLERRFNAMERRLSRVDRLDAPERDPFRDDAPKGVSRGTAPLPKGAAPSDAGRY